MVNLIVLTESLTSCSQAMSSSLVLPLGHEWTRGFYKENTGMLLFWPGHIHGKLLAPASVCPFQERISSRNKRQKVAMFID